MEFANDFELGGDHVHHDGDEHPEQDDRHREDAQHVREEGALGVLVGLGRRGRVRHADFTRQYVWALTPLADCSSRTVPFTVTRHPI